MPRGQDSFEYGVPNYAWPLNLHSARIDASVRRLREANVASMDRIGYVHLTKMGIDLIVKLNLVR